MSAPAAIQHPFAQVTRKRSRGLRVAFLNTAGSVDLALFWALLPCWWILGVEQFVAPVLLIFSAIRSRVRSKGGTQAPLRWLAVFLCVYLISGLFIVESVRYVTFGRGLVAYIGAFLVGTLAASECRSVAARRLAVHAFVIAIVLSAAAGLVGFLGVWRPEFQSFLASLLPSDLLATRYGEASVSRSLGQEAWIFGTEYFRVKGFFLFSTMCATAIAVTIPVSLYCVVSATRWRTRAGWCCASAILVAGLVATTGRMAIGALIIGAIITFATTMSRSIWSRSVILLGLVVATSGVVAYMGPDQLAQDFDSALYARDGSYAQRVALYEATITGFEQRPVFGWGTERDVPGLPYPAGSHSYYLGVLYRHGTIGLIVLALLLVSLSRECAPSEGVDKDARYFLLFARWSFWVFAINAITDAPDLDSLTLECAWMVFGVALACRAEGVRGGTLNDGRSKWHPLRLLRLRPSA